MRSRGDGSLMVSFVPRPSARADIVLYLGSALLFYTLKCWESQVPPNLRAALIS